MNSAERIFTALRGQIPDRVPIFEWFVHPKVYQAMWLPHLSISPATIRGK